MMPGTDLIVVNKATGEMIDLATAGDEEIVSFHEGTVDLQAQLGDAATEANRALLGRLDRALKWTQQVGRFELKAPSPTAGTTEYPEGELERALRELVAEGVTNAAGAAAVLKRQLVVVFDVPLDSDLSDTRDRVYDVLGRALELRIAGVVVSLAEVKVSTKTILAGVDKLRKLPGAAEALDRVKVTKPAGARRVSVRPLQGA